MNNLIQEIKDYLDKPDNFYMKLRAYEGFDEEDFRELINILKKISVVSRNSTVISKELAHIICGLIPNLEPTLYLYSDIYVKEKINKSIDVIQQSIDEILLVK